MLAAFRVLSIPIIPALSIHIGFATAVFTFGTLTEDLGPDGGCLLTAAMKTSHGHDVVRIWFRKVEADKRGTADLLLTRAVAHGAIECLVPMLLEVAHLLLCEVLVPA